MATPEEKRPGGPAVSPAENPGSAMVGIPRAVFVVRSFLKMSVNPLIRAHFIRCAQPDIGKFMKEPGNTSAEVVLRKFDENYRKYKFMEANLSVKKSR